MELDIRTQLDPICWVIVQTIVSSIFRQDPAELKIGWSRAQNLQAVQRGSLAIAQTGKAYLGETFYWAFLGDYFCWAFWGTIFVEDLDEAHFV